MSGLKQSLHYNGSMLREFRVTTIDSKIYIFPVPVIKERKYLILCSSLEEAQLLMQLIQSEKLQHPDLVSPDFIFLTTHTDGQTRIFIPNPEWVNK